MREIRSTTKSARHGSARPLLPSQRAADAPRSHRHRHISRNDRSEHDRSTSTHKHFQPGRVVQVEPVVLLSNDLMASLYKEQSRRPLPALGRVLPSKTSAQGNEQPQDEPRTSGGSSRPRTSASSSISPPSPYSDEEELLSDDDADMEEDKCKEPPVLLEEALAPPRSVIRQRECQVCYEPMAARDAKGCSSCRSSFCGNCMRWYIEYKILEGEVSAKKLVCPAPQCTQPLSEELIQSFVSATVFAKYLKYRENQQPGVRFCPRAGCCARINEPLHATSRHVHCESCEHESCMKCGDAFHLLPTCRRKERRYGKWRRHNNVRKCPGCKTDIEKQGGCAHMKCFQCDNEFCWSCVRPWDDHDETLCVPLTFLKSKNPKYGFCSPVRAVTKSAVVGAAAVVALAGAGIAVVVLPPVLLYHWVKTSPRFRSRVSLHSDAFIIE